MTDGGDDPQRVDETLRDLVPRDRRAPYDVRRLMTSVFDVGSVVELARRYAPSTVTALARLDGWPVAGVSRGPQGYGGGGGAPGAPPKGRLRDPPPTVPLPA